MSDRYACPDCGGEMWTIAKMSDPPIYEARCPSCGAVYRRDRNYAANPLPRSYVKVAPPAAIKDGGE